MENEIRRRHSSNKEACKASKREDQQSPDRPYHIPRNSLFSSSQYTNFKALFNTIILLMIMSTASFMYEHGTRFELWTYLIQKAHAAILNPSESPTIFFAAGVNLFIIASYIIELGFVKKRLSEEAGRVIIILNLLSLLLFPVILVFQVDSNPNVAIAVVAFVILLFLKLVSYHVVNYWCRTFASSKTGDYKENDSQIHQNSSLISYPHNVCLKDLCYFIMVPTLCYQLNFPRSERIRKTFLVARIIEMVFLPEMLLAIYCRWMKDLLHNRLQEGNVADMVATLFKIAVPLNFMAMIFFYLLFHSLFNFFAELLMFADREFYEDWWDADSFAIFWRRWNIPVHQWCKKHIYKPLLLRGFSKQSAAFTVFFVSAILHEYLASLPVKSFLIWPFFCMLVQALLILFVDWYQVKKCGNIAVWTMLFTLVLMAMVTAYQHFIPFL